MRLVFTLGLALLAGLGCASTRAAEEKDSAVPEVLPPELQAAALGPGDIIEIKVFREPDLAGVYRVSPDGSLDFPLVGRIELLGKQADEVGEVIRARLADGYLRNPQVSVFIKEFNSQKIHVFGQVSKAGTFPYEPAMTIIQAITNAGGFGRLAQPNRVSVTRNYGDREKTFVLRVGDIGQGTAPNFELRPGDIVFVPEAIF
ncbi:MAG: polysaccharide biosynthesis/export family protein [Myxococcota bacterium]